MNENNFIFEQNILTELVEQGVIDSTIMGIVLDKLFTEQENKDVVALSKAS